MGENCFPLAGADDTWAERGLAVKRRTGSLPAPVCLVQSPQGWPLGADCWANWPLRGVITPSDIFGTSGAFAPKHKDPCEHLA